MKAFATLLDRLNYTPARNGKLTLLRDYFRAAPDPDRGYALAALTDGFVTHFPLRRLLQDLAQTRFDEALFRLSRDYVGDTAETVSLMWRGQSPEAAPSLHDVAEAITRAERAHYPALLENWLDRLDVNGRWALLKFIGGAPRVGVSARLAKIALAEAFGRKVEEVEDVWHGLKPPYLDLFAWLEGSGPSPQVSDAPVFKPLMLSHPLEDADWAALDLDEFSVEWKWDGIRVQIARRGGETRLFSRSGEDIGGAFPEIIAAFTRAAIVDGELLVMRGGHVAPFGDLQQRLNRVAASPKLLKDFPTHVRLYDALEIDGVDLRGQSLVQRRAALESFAASLDASRFDLSPLLHFADKAALEDAWRKTREDGVEGLMLKRTASPYLAGRVQGHWYKFKRAPLTADCVLLYAQRGSGKRSSYYSDYTFAAWDDRGPQRVLVPVGKAYSGFTDEELLKLDRFVRNNTIERFGPVRSVEPKLVLEVAFDAIQLSKRHKSGLAMRFPRIARIRWDKPADEADTVTSLLTLMPKDTGAG